jgi:CO/xanthine dehydrogenase Mo-binding subunit
VDYQWIGKSVVREDARDKVAGKTRYMTDLVFPGLTWGTIVRSGIPHAEILAIDTAEAENCPGVLAVVTHRDVPGSNAYGIACDDQPVFCCDRVRYEGDPVAGVVAETREIAARAAGKIRIAYRELPGVFDPFEALADGAPLVHDRGNLLLGAHVVNGDVAAAFRDADLVVERDYFCPIQFPAYLEPEGGVAWYRDGFLTIWCGSQYPTQDQQQIGRVLGIPGSQIRIVSNPVGGAFGGKDDLTVQPQLAIMALKAGFPVKLVNTREESNKTSWKRHPMSITMKTAAKLDGTLLANQVRIVADTGAYAGLGGAVLTNTIGHACGAYRVPNIDVEGRCVYTNNCPNSAMRGFGVPQINFAMESQMEIIAGDLGLDPLQIRLKNCLVTGDRGPLGHTLAMTMGTLPALLRARDTELWRRRTKEKLDDGQAGRQSGYPWKKRGIGIAACIKGVGLGKGLPDYSAADIILTGAGDYLVFVGCPEMGQGNHIAFVQMAAEALGCPLHRVRVVQGDSSCTPDSGVAAASRTVYAVGNAILLAAEEIKRQLQQLAAEFWDVAADAVCWDADQVRHGESRISVPELALLAKQRRLEIGALSHFDMPTADRGVEDLYGIPSLLYGSTVQIAMVEVDIRTGCVDVLESVCIPDAGKIINIQGLEGQAEGGTVMGMGYALVEKGIIRNGRTLTDNYATYLIPTSLDCPGIAVLPVEEREATGPFGAKGIAEALSSAMTPAVVNAIHDAVGVRITRLPVTAEDVYAGLLQKVQK